MKKLKIIIYSTAIILNFGVFCDASKILQNEIQRHVVKKGQTLWAISNYYNVPLEEIAEENNLNTASKLRIGQILKIPISRKKIKMDLGIFQWPLNGEIISHFNQKLPDRINKGIDIKPQDSFLVHASKKGIVEFSKALKGYGYTIILNHSQGVNTVYSNLSSSFVKEKEFVEENQPIGKIGKDVRKQEAFLHFEIRKEDVPLNPLHHLP
ncbi:MAG: peptidoglycan DD-metalloendopeptidase family protein [Candidatus Omnitrophica bacterium]|nr:peptidoglycan DD-metalloendopeptidase family protein [Candidatus Omnitrophota bacterium]